MSAKLVDVVTIVGDSLSAEFERFGDRLELFDHSLELSCFAF